MSLDELAEIESCMTRSRGSCNTMGTASTMACMSEALGIALPQNGAIPASDSRRLRLAHLSGRRIVEMVKEGLTMSQVLTRSNFENAIRILAAIGGSTNAVVHLLAIAGRLGVELTLDDFDRFTRESPLLVNLRPSGEHLMEDFFYSGGLPTVIHHLRDILDGDALTLSGRSRHTPIPSRPKPLTTTSSARWTIRSNPSPALRCCEATCVLRGRYSNQTRPRPS